MCSRNTCSTRRSPHSAAMLSMLGGSPHGGDILCTATRGKTLLCFTWTAAKRPRQKVCNPQQQPTSNKQQATSNRQQATSNIRRATIDRFVMVLLMKRAIRALGPPKSSQRLPQAPQRFPAAPRGSQSASTVHRHHTRLADHQPLSTNHLPPAIHRASRVAHRASRIARRAGVGGMCRRR